MTFLIILITSICVFGALWLAMRNQARLYELSEQQDELADELLTQQRQKRISRYRHDLANHLRTLEALSEGAGSAEVLKTICMVKQDACRAEGIEVKTRIGAGGWEALSRTGSSMELVGLLSNLWDNAIEAVLRMDSPAGQEIRFELERCTEGIKLVLDNPYGMEPDFKTDKGDDHGHGLKIIKETIEDKKGRLDMSTADHRCRMVCVLPEQEDT